MTTAACPAVAHVRPSSYPGQRDARADERYNAPGAIGWALSQPDGTIVDLPVEMVAGEWYGGQVLGIREWFEPLVNGPNLFLYLDKPAPGLAQRMGIVDIIGGCLTTLPDGHRAIINPTAVYAYTDSAGAYMLPLPWDKHPIPGAPGRAGSEWPYKKLISP